MNLVPKEASQIETSPSFSLVETTSGGVKIYIRKLTRQEADAVVIGSSDDEFLSDQKETQFFIVPIRDNRILRSEELDAQDVLDFLEVLAAHGG